MTDDDPSEQLILDKVRVMWEFAATTQFLYLFFDMFGLQEFDVEVPLLSCPQLSSSDMEQRTDNVCVRFSNKS
jgi:hypothetical protein